jgi:hypothetical protein
MIALLLAGLIAASNPPAAPDSSAADSSAAASAPAADSSFESIEPPEDAVPDRDYEDERADRLDPGVVELGYALSQSGAGPLRRRRRVRVRVRERGLEAQVREGRADALSGAEIGARIGAGWIAAGRASPRWARGLVVGMPRDPWSGTLELSEASRSRATAGDGVEYRRDGALPLELLAQRVRRTTFAGASVGGEAGGAGVVVARTAARTRPPLASVWGARGPSDAELALDARGRWRADARLSPACDPRLALEARFGHESFEGAVPARTPRPALALATRFQSGSPPLSLALLAAWWRFRAAVTGARAALEVRAVLPHHDVLALGCEERHGARRLPLATARPEGFRQGAWLGWNGGDPRLAMRVRHEWWSARGGLRDLTRRVASAGLETRPLRSCELGVAIALYRTRGGEPQYLSEDEVDRRVLRALTGAGRRTRLQAGFPAAGGSVRAALTLAETGGRASPPQWTLDWTRRAHTR